MATMARLGKVPRLRFTAVSLLLMLALTGCEALNTASDTLDRAEVCTKALAAAGFNPNLSDPAGSVQEAQRKAEELRSLASQTGDANLQRELRETADQIGSLQQREVNPTDVVAWTNRKLEQLNQLQQACA
jgi:hypothetical protein